MPTKRLHGSCYFGGQTSQWMHFSHLTLNEMVSSLSRSVSYMMLLSSCPFLSLLSHYSMGGSFSPQAARRTPPAWAPCPIQSWHSDRPLAAHQSSCAALESPYHLLFSSSPLPPPSWDNNMTLRNKTTGNGFIAHQRWQLHFTDN